MGTDIRNEVSKKNKYWLPRHRHLELKHFCMQYDSWKKAYVDLDGWGNGTDDMSIFVKTNSISNPTARCVEARTYYFDRIQMLEKTAKEADLVLWDYILYGVTKGVSYDVVRVQMNVPCCKDVYYASYRRFFWLLSKARQ